MPTLSFRLSDPRFFAIGVHASQIVVAMQLTPAFSPEEFTGARTAVQFCRNSANLIGYWCLDFA